MSDTYTTLGASARTDPAGAHGDTLDVSGRKMKVIAVDGLRIAKVLLSPRAESPGE